MNAKCGGEEPDFPLAGASYDIHGKVSHVRQQDRSIARKNVKTDKNGMAADLADCC